MNRDLDVVGIGNALVDVIVEIDPSVIAEHGLVKGSMALMALEDAERIHQQLAPGTQQSGGSAANTMAGLAALGSRVGFIGRIGCDGLGHAFAGDIAGLGVALSVAEAPAGATGRSLILVTPDADRTMCTSLGVSAELAAGDIDIDLISRASVTYLEGYLFDLPVAKDAYREAITVAHRAGQRVAMSLSDPFCVARHREDIAGLVDTGLDLLFGNEEEVCMLTGVDDVAAACRLLRRPGLTVTVTLGARGALAFDADGPIVDVPASPVERVVDTTGAGDLYAAGFLHGFTQGFDLGRCARLGGVAAAEVISHVGARPIGDLAALAAPVLVG